LRDVAQPDPPVEKPHWPDFSGSRALRRDESGASTADGGLDRLHGKLHRALSSSGQDSRARRRDQAKGGWVASVAPHRPNVVPSPVAPLREIRRAPTVQQSRGQCVACRTFTVHVALSTQVNYLQSVTHLDKLHSALKLLIARPNRVRYGQSKEGCYGISGLWSEGTGRPRRAAAVLERERQFRRHRLRCAVPQARRGPDESDRRRGPRPPGA